MTKNLILQLFKIKIQKLGQNNSAVLQNWSPPFYADMHGFLKVMLNTLIRNKSILEFEAKVEVMKILNLADGLDEDAYEGIYEQ